MQNTTLTRIENVLNYIHAHLDEPIQVTDLAEKSCWSRWQFQRVFGIATGLTAAQYIRELRLSKAAELLLKGQNKHLEIAIACGFDSEISFSRAFKQMFQCTPKQYRQRGKRVGLRTPLKHCMPKRKWVSPTAFTQIRIENRPAFKVMGHCDWISGPFSKEPNFLEQVPKVWQSFVENYPTHFNELTQNPIGVIDTRENQKHPDELLYWAGYTTNSQQAESTLEVPEQEYAVIPVHGEVRALESAVEWFFFHWLPESSYCNTPGFELEVYTPNYDPHNKNSYMEYWLPIEPRNTSSFHLI
ncbi:AraC family transcriptional regulator [Marinomonas sp. C2222]|uniref:AraC family transcriptional regulator n=1 Tax=Marinomonas sargassi TaxID=2984494 RepID=A0ABT2YQ87_9GAMM|nr:AraC family transcriptional regulator [Marinomonas sargassi]MCV2402016.1 AraC family transcriptional regulator [Marinomonas sargassi]